MLLITREKILTTGFLPLRRTYVFFLDSPVPRVRLPGKKRKNTSRAWRQKTVKTADYQNEEECVTCSRSKNQHISLIDHRREPVFFFSFSLDWEQKTVPPDEQEKGDWGWLAERDCVCNFLYVFFFFFKYRPSCVWQQWSLPPPPLPLIPTVLLLNTKGH